MVNSLQTENPTEVVIKIDEYIAIKINKNYCKMDEQVSSIVDCRNMHIH